MMELYPSWKNAVRELLNTGLTFGSTLSRDHLISLCKIKPATVVEDVRRFDLEVLQAVYSIKESLLTNHCMLLATDNGGGYIVLRPEDQTAYSIKTGTRALKKEMGRMAKGVSFVQVGMLNDEQRKVNADAQAKISQLAGMMKPLRSELKQLVNDADD